MSFEMPPGDRFDREPKKQAKELKEKAEKFIAEHKDLFHTLVRDRSLDFKVGNGFAINLDTGVITLDVKDFEALQEKKLSEWQIIWSVCHELAHFMDLREDAAGMMKIFSYLKRRAKELAPQVLEIWARKLGGKVPEDFTKQAPIDKEGKETMSFVERFLYERLHRNLINVTDDIYVNRLVAKRVGAFSASGSQAEQSVTLYRDHLFPTNPSKRGEPPADEFEAADFSGLPKSQQLNDALLRRHMVPGQEVLVSDEVRETHHSYSDESAEAAGFDYEKEILKVLTNPESEVARRAGTRYEAVKKVVEPKFLELLFQDLEELPPPKIEKGKGKGEGDPWDMPEGTPEPIDENTIKDFFDQQKKKAAEDRKKKKQENRTPERKLKDAQAEKDKNVLKGKADTPEEAKGLMEAAREYRRIQQEIDAYSRDLADVFEQVMHTVEERISQAWAKAFKSGRLNVGMFIQKYGPELAAEQLQMIPWTALDVYDQKEFISRLSIVPNQIRVRLVLDGSGSMVADRIKAVKELTVLMLQGLTAFEETMNLRFRMKKPFQVDTEVRMFGSTTKVVKSFAADKRTFDDEMTDRFKAFNEIESKWGGTDDSQPLSQIVESITPELEEDLKNGKAMEFVFEITDGGSATEQVAKEKVNELIEKKVVIKGFQIGNPSEQEQATFTGIFQENGSIIPTPADLAPTLATQLAEEILNKKFTIQYEDEPDMEDD